MIKSLFILILTFTFLASWSQKSITTDGPCTDAMAMQAKGRWLKHEDPPTSKEVNNILNEIHTLVIKIYPQPTGVDAVWGKTESISYFGAKQKSSTDTDSRPEYEAIELPHFRKYNYRCGFFRYTCDHSNNTRMLPGYPAEETGTWVTITANDRQPAISEVIDGSWTINGMGVRLLSPVTKTTDSFIYGGSNNFRYVLIHRKGILPYIPVTRKQYLERCFGYHNKLWDENIKRTETLTVRSLEEQEKEKNAKLAKFEKDFGKDPKRLKSAVDYYLSGYKTDQQMRDEQVQKAKNNKERELKKFIDELEKTTQQGLLDSPAMIRVMYNSDLIFDTDLLQANMVVIENRDYIRKDLPKHVPQLFLVNWTGSDWAPQAKIAGIMEKDFPFEKLQAMIDK